MSEARQTSRSEYHQEGAAESESLLSSTTSPFEPSPHPHPLLLCDLSHLQQPAPSNYQQQQQHKGCSYFPEDEDDDEDDEEDEDSKQGSSSRRINSPFSPHCRIPLPDFTFNGYNGGGGLLLAHHLDTGTFIRRRNERERTRVRNVNEGFERLRAHLPPLYSPAPVSSNGASRAAGGAREGGGRKSSSNSSSSSSSTAAAAAASTAESRRLSKVETLRLAIAYIKQLQEALRC